MPNCFNGCNLLIRNAMIPKIIHYIWVGESDLPARNAALIAKNAQHCAGYNIRLWRETDLDLTAPFVQRAYAAKKWAFVSDYLRFKILAEHGGIYLDTDMELFRPLTPLLSDASFAGLNREGNYVFCGVIGAEPQHRLMQQLVRDYDALPPHHYPTSPQMLTAATTAAPGDDFHIHPFHYFYPVDEGGTGDPALLKEAYATHHWDESWRSYVPLRRFLRRIGVIPLYHRLLKHRRG